MDLKYFIGKSEIGNFIHYTLYNLIYPIENQECKGVGKDFWCRDWEEIEILKCLYIGIDRYLSDPIPRRLIGNSNFKQKNIIQKVEEKQEMLNKIEEIMSDVNSVFIPNVGRGIDILLLNFYLKKWKCYCCDKFDYENYLQSQFGERIRFSISENLEEIQKRIKEKYIFNGEVYGE